MKKKKKKMSRRWNDGISRKQKDWRGREKSKCKGLH